MLRIILPLLVCFVTKPTKQLPLEDVLSPALSLPQNLTQNSRHNGGFSNNCKSNMLSKKEQEERDSYFKEGFDNYFTDNYSEAKEDFEKGLEIATKVCDKDSLFAAAVIYKHLGKIYETQKNYSQAINAYKEELNIYNYDNKTVFEGLLHPNIAITSETIATIYYKQQDYEKAEEYYYQAADVFSKTLGKKKPATIKAIYELRKVYLLKRNFMTELQEEFLNKDTWIDLNGKMLLHQSDLSFVEFSIVMVVSMGSMFIFCSFLVKIRIVA